MSMELSAFYASLARHHRARRLESEQELKDVWDLSLAFLNATRNFLESPTEPLFLSHFTTEVEVIREKLLKIASKGE